MKTTAIFAFVAAATFGYAAEAGGEQYAAPQYDGSSPSPYPPYHPPAPYVPSNAPNKPEVPKYEGGGGWSGHRGGRFGGKSWGPDNDGGSYYGSCASCVPPPPGYATPPEHIRWPTKQTDFPPGPFRDNFGAIGNSCASVNNNGNGPHAAGCCSKTNNQNGGDQNGGGGLLGGLLNGLGGDDTVCTLDILSSVCSSGSVACCPVSNTGDGVSVINGGICAPITI